jgi:hypothetical protein
MEEDVMKIRNVIGLAAIGGLLYMHRKRGGEWTVDSVRDSAKQLWNGVQAGAEKAKAEARRELEDARSAAQQMKAEMEHRARGNPESGRDRFSR